MELVCMSRFLGFLPSSFLLLFFLSFDWCTCWLRGDVISLAQAYSLYLKLYVFYISYETQVLHMNAHSVGLNIESASTDLYISDMIWSPCLKFVREKKEIQILLIWEWSVRYKFYLEQMGINIMTHGAHMFRNPDVDLWVAPCLVSKSIGSGLLYSFTIIYFRAVSQNHGCFRTWFV